MENLENDLLKAIKKNCPVIGGTRNAANDCADITRNYTKKFAEWVAGYTTLSEAIRFFELKDIDELMAKFDEITKK